MFRTTSKYPIIPMEEAWRRVAARMAPLPAASYALGEALGLVLAEDVQAVENMPPFASSAMDGYAVIASDVGPRRVIGEQNAGPDRELTVEPGTAARLMTGGPVPRGADAVVPVEYTEADGDYVALKVDIVPGQHVRPAGQDIATGDLVLIAGQEIGPAEIGLLATMGRAEVRVHPRPTVALMATGDELVPLGEPLAPGHIRDSNSHAMAAAVRAAGFTAHSMGLIPDNIDALRRAILDGVGSADMVLTSGGVSMGTRDLIKPLLEELGVVHFGRVAVKPGKPLTYATVRDVPVFGLPGFPVSSLVGFENVVRPALRIMAGHRRIMRPEIEVQLSHDIAHAPDRTEYQRAVVTVQDGIHVATTTGNQVSGRLKSLVGANALLRLPAGIDRFRAGETVTAILITMPEVEYALPKTSDAS